MSRCNALRPTKMPVGERARRRIGYFGSAGTRASAVTIAVNIVVGRRQIIIPGSVHQGHHCGY